MIFSDKSMHFFEDTIFAGELIGAIYLRSRLAHFTSYHQPAAGVVIAVIVGDVCDGHFADAFNSMLEEIGRRDQALQRHQLELDSQVE